MASQKLLDLLNEAIARELQVSIEYMWQHILVKGIYAESIGGIFKKIAIDEMKHAEKIAERLDYLGGKPTTKPTQINVGEKAEEMLNQDVKDEETAINLYKNIIKIAIDENDVVTKRLFEEILSDEEEHHNTFLTLLGK
jgi:bacterioferritin